MTATLEEAPRVEPMEVSSEPGHERNPRLHTLSRYRPNGSLGSSIGLIVALLAAWLVLYILILSGWGESRSQATLYDDFRSSVAQEIAPFGGAISPGTPVAVFTIPSIGIDDLVAVEGTSSSTMRAGPGHRRDSPLPGQPGVSIFYGRGTSFGAPFRRLDALHPGAVISATTGQGIFNYQVTAVVRAGQTVPMSALSSATRLTLESSGGSLLTHDHTIDVIAALRGQSVPPPSARPSSVPANELPMASDTGTLTELLLWLEGLALALAGLTWSRSRWGRWQAMTAGLPVVLALLWGATTAAAPLLPNLF